MVETLRICVRRSPETNDHEVCLGTDEGDLITRFADGLIGMDPDDLLTEPCPLRVRASPTSATIGRCECGIVGCGSVEVTMRRHAGVVSWTTQARPVGVSFAAEQYDAEVERAMRDFSWETPDRTAARLIREGVDHELLRRRGFRFCWASGRITPNSMTLALASDADSSQQLFEVAWADDAPEGIASRCIEFLASPPEQWRGQ